VNGNSTAALKRHSICVYRYKGMTVVWRRAKKAPCPIKIYTLKEISDKIEHLRYEMEELAQENGLLHSEVLAISQKLDTMLKKYYKIGRLNAKKADPPQLFLFKGFDLHVGGQVQHIAQGILV
jgi:hypothetical protein